MTLQHRVQLLEFLSTAMRFRVCGCVVVALWRRIARINRLLGLSVSSRRVLAKRLFFFETQSIRRRAERTCMTKWRCDGSMVNEVLMVYDYISTKTERPSGLIGYTPYRFTSYSSSYVNEVRIN